LSCRDCNNIKGDKYPVTSSGEPIINPCDDAPDEHLTFEYLDFPGGVITTVGYITPRGKITVELFELNNRSDLVKRRGEVVKPLIQLSRFAVDDTEARHLLEEASLAKAEYAAFARALLNQLEQ